MMPLAYSMTLKHWCQILVGKFIDWRIHPSLKTWRTFKEKCATLKVISCLCFFIEIIWLVLMNVYMNNTLIIIRILISSKLKMSNFLRGCKILVLPPMFQIVIWYITWRILMTWWIIRNVEIWMGLMCLKVSLKRSQHLMWWKRNLNCLLMKVMQFLKKSMIPIHWNQSTKKCFTFFKKPHDNTNMDPSYH